MVVTGQICSQAMQTMWQGVSMAMVSNGEMKPAGCGQTATHAPHLMQAFQLMLKITGFDLAISLRDFEFTKQPLFEASLI
jgi:hypothetical protein